MELTDILPVEDWSQLEKELFDRFHLNFSVYDTSGTAITGKPEWCNKICPEVKANKDSLAAICATGNQHFMAQAEKTRQAVIGECDAGLIKIAVPISLNGEFMGTVGGCGRLPEGGELETFMLQKLMGLSAEQVAELSRGLEPMSMDQARQVAEYIEKRVAELTKN